MNNVRMKVFGRMFKTGNVTVNLLMYTIHINNLYECFAKENAFSLKVKIIYICILYFSQCEKYLYP